MALEAPKPRNEVIHPGITRLPEITGWRRIVRRLVHWMARLVVRICTRVEVVGLEHLQIYESALVVANHLGDADVVVGVAYSPMNVEVIAKSELYDFPILGWLMDTYGVIWVRRGQPDKKAIRAALQAFDEKRKVAIAPEARESLTGGLEEGTGGAAYLALKADVPIIPVTFTGTENQRVLNNLRHLRRTPVTLTVGSPFQLKKLTSLKEAIQAGTETIMKTLAKQLPPEYRGVYRPLGEDQHGPK
ncbi:MAG: lysophospholipid acyltransferase family protein [Anaerolineales bacterium]|jgi:1-acyl-sn-glycerol-3-phosphate acyltransferase